MNIRKDDTTVEAFGYSLALTSLLSSVLVIVKEGNEPLKLMMKAATGHHWITHGLIVLTLFIVLGFFLASVIPRNSGIETYDRVATAVITATFLGGSLIAGFYFLGV